MTYQVWVKEVVQGDSMEAHFGEHLSATLEKLLLLGETKHTLSQHPTLQKVVNYQAKLEKTGKPTVCALSLN